jgi:hypothetical protein
MGSPYIAQSGLELNSWAQVILPSQPFQVADTTDVHNHAQLNNSLEQSTDKGRNQEGN